MGSWTWQSSTQGGFSWLSRLISQDGRDKHPWDIAPLAQPPCGNPMQFPFHELQPHFLDITHTPSATRAAVLLSNALAVSTLPWWVLFESLCVIKQPFYSWFLGLGSKLDQSWPGNQSYTYMQTGINRSIDFAVRFSAMFASFPTLEGGLEIENWCSDTCI